MYVPNLLPENSRVEFDFNEFVSQKKKLSVGLIILHIISFFTLCAALNIFTHFLFGVCFIFLTLLVFPFVNDFVEKRFSVQIRFKIKIIPILIVLILAIVITNYDAQKDEVAQRKVENEKMILAQSQEKAKQDSIKTENQRKDSLNKFITLAFNNEKNRSFQNAIKFYHCAIEFERDNNNKDEIHYKIAFLNLFLKKPLEEIKSFNEISNVSKYGDTVFYEVALAYINLSDKKSAVGSLNEAMKIGSERAEKLYNRINPLKKRIVSYVTLCCDGTTTTRKGRGTCSRHGGVCDWNHPVYEEYREY